MKVISEYYQTCPNLTHPPPFFIKKEGGGAKKEDEPKYSE
jgi:hypothetical protein